jgi:hypothetical protein
MKKFKAIVRGLNLKGYSLSKIFYNGYFLLEWMDSNTKTRNKRMFDTIEGVEGFLLINKEIFGGK